MGKFEPRWSYKIVLIKKARTFNSVVLLAAITNVHTAVLLMRKEVLNTKINIKHYIKDYKTSSVDYICNKMICVGS